MSFDHSRGRATSGSTAEHGAFPTVGKRTLTAGLSAVPVQLAGDGTGTAPAKDAAPQGVSGASRQLPHLASIQRLFGRHDVSQVKAHVGGEAAAAAQSMGAQAYATGDHVAFRESPDLHLAAHEAAHVVQQRGGVQLAGGLGREGDPYERHADAVADQVVQGKSAEALLDVHAGKAGAGPGSGAVQKKDDPALAAFKAKKHEVLNHGPSTGRGAFDATYDANTGELTITLKLKFTKEDDGVSAWTAAEIATWKGQYQAAIQARWGGQYTMQCTKAGWESLVATTKVVLSWVDKDPHFELKVKKVGAGNFRPESAVTQPGGQDRTAHAPGTYATPSSQGTTKLGDTDVTERDKDKWTANTIATEVKRANSANPKTVAFTENSDAVAGADQTRLGELGTILAMIKQPKMNVAIDGFAATGEADKAALSQRRADSVKKAVAGAGSLTHAVLASGKGDTGADATPAWRKVAIAIGNAEAGWKNDYDIAGHETGHMFGFDEEYAGGAKESSHYKLVEEAFGTKVADTFVKRKAGEDSASVMDGGLDVRPYHYVTFWEALGRCTEPDLKRTDWKIKV
jgi:outer membrane protein OmpA-like peptidoglycan-associated protein